MTVQLRLGFDLGVARLRGALADGGVVAELSEPTRKGSAREIAVPTGVDPRTELWPQLQASAD